MKVIQHTLRESVIVALAVPFINWGIAALSLATCAALQIGRNPYAVREVFKPGFALFCLMTGVAMGVLYASSIGSCVEIGEGVIRIKRRNGDEECADLAAIRNWRYDRRRRITLVLLDDGRELTLPRLAPIKIWILKSAVRRELALLQTRPDGAG